MVRTGPLEGQQPRNNAAFHARQAEELLHLARSASAAGWLRRNYRRELLAAAQIHATLASGLDLQSGVMY